MNAPADLPLAGIRVIDLTRLLPGPFATLHLAQWGAKVFKIEGPAEQAQDDPTRHMGRTPAEVAAGQPGMAFRMLNSGKQLQTLDLRKSAGRDALIDAVRDADVLIEGFRPGVMDRLGLGWDVLHGANPRLVMCAISGYGRNSVWSQRAGHDINYIAMAGVLAQIGTDVGDIAVSNFQIGDLGGSQAALSGVLAALVAAQRTGIGRFVDVSMTHGVMRHNVIVAATLVATGKVAAPGTRLALRWCALLRRLPNFGRTPPRCGGFGVQDLAAVVRSAG